MASTTNAPAQTAAPAQESSEGFQLIPNARLREMYATMLKCRMLGERLLQNTAGASGFGLGQEAVVAGVVPCLLPGDALFASSCGLTARLGRGEPLRQLLANRLVPSPDAPLALSVEAVAALNQPATGKAAVAFFDEAQVSPAAWLDAFTRAGAQKLPVLFVCQCEPSAESGKGRAPHGFGSAAQAALASRFPAIAVDGHDAVAVYRVASEALTHARKGNGPTLIECKPFPIGLAAEATHDPIRNMETYLAQRSLFDPGFKIQVQSAFAEELDSAFASAPQPL